MTVAEFLDWNADNRHGRYELHEGRPVAMAPERVGHTRVKFRVAATLLDAITRAGLNCEMLTDGPTIRVDEHTAYGPNALVYCGGWLADDVTVVPAPIIVVEVLPPSTMQTDLAAKLAGYFRVPSIQHYLVLDGERRLVVHHARGEHEVIATRIVTEGVLDLTPPNIRIPVEKLFGR